MQAEWIVGYELSALMDTVSGLHLALVISMDRNGRTEIKATDASGEKVIYLAGGPLSAYHLRAATQLMTFKWGRV